MIIIFFKDELHPLHMVAVRNFIWMFLMSFTVMLYGTKLRTVESVTPNSFTS